MKVSTAFCYNINKQQVQCKFISAQQYLKYEVREQASKTTLQNLKQRPLSPKFQ